MNEDAGFLIATAVAGSLGIGGIYLLRWLKRGKGKIDFFTAMRLKQAAIALFALLMLVLKFIDFVISFF